MYQIIRKQFNNSKKQLQLIYLTIREIQLRQLHIIRVCFVTYVDEKNTSTQRLD